MYGRVLGSLIVACVLAGSASASRPPTPLLNVPRADETETDPVWETLSGLEMDLRWAASESLATVLVNRFEASSQPDSLGISHAFLFVANGLIRRRIYADGRGFAALERAIGIRERLLGPKDDLAVWAHVVAATFYTEAGRPDLAVLHGRAAQDQLDPTKPEDLPLLGQAHLGSATGLNALRRYDEARGEYEEALRIRETAFGPENRNLIPMLAEYGAFLGRIGEFDEAEAMLKRAVHVAEIDDAAGHASDFLDGSLSRLSTLVNRTGNVAESLELAQRAYELSRTRWGESSIPTVRLRTVIAYRLEDLGDFTGAAALLREIVPAMESALGTSHSQTQNARLALLEALVEIGDTTAAKTQLVSARESMAAQDPLANSNWTYFLEQTAGFETLQGHIEAARDTLAIAINLEERKQDPVGETMGDLLADLLETTRGPEDRPMVSGLQVKVDALAESTGVRATPAWSHLLGTLAAAEARVGLREAAWEHALEADRLGRERLGYELRALPDSRALSLAGTLGAPCELVTGLARADDPRDVATAWDRLVRWRGLVRQEISRRRAPAGGTPEILDAHARWIAAQRKLGQLVVSGFASPEDPDTAERFQTARREAEEAERKYVRAASADLGPAEAVRLEDVLATLGSDAALVAFAIADDGAARGLGAFVATGRDRKPMWIPLGPLAEVQTAVRAWDDVLGTEPTGNDGEGEAECRRLGASVRKLLWDPIARHLGEASRIVVIPEGPAGDVPWAALPGPGDTYLADEPLVLEILEAERDLLAGPATPPGTGLLAVGGPDFDAGGEADGAVAAVGAVQPSRAWRCTGEGSLKLPPLPDARAEVEEIAGRWSRGSEAATLLVGPGAEESAFKQRAPGHAVIHLATHGVLMDASCASPAGPGSRGIGGMNPLPGNTVKAPRPGAGSTERPNPWLGVRVWLALAGANLPPESHLDENEGLLTAEEVVTLDLRGTDWVVLSACHSALAAAWAREGVLGMQRAFHLAGARAVIASRWSVGDASAREWMAALYGARKPGGSAGEAVDSARRTVLESRRRDGRSTHPFYWAAFTASGS